MMATVGLLDLSWACAGPARNAVAATAAAPRNSLLLIYAPPPRETGQIIADRVRNGQAMGGGRAPRHHPQRPRRLSSSKISFSRGVRSRGRSTVRLRSEERR